MTEQAEYCEALVRNSDKDRFLATLFAPAGRRADLFALYAFDLEIAAVAHRVRDPAAGEIRLHWWQDTLSADERAADHPVAAAIVDVLRRHAIDRRVALDLIDARRRALYPDQDESEAAFELSAAESDGAILAGAAQVLGGPPDNPTRLAAHHAGIVAAVARSASDGPAAHRTAARHREAARALVSNLPDAVLPAFLPIVLAVENRSRLPQWRKQWILWRASKNLARWM